MAHRIKFGQPRKRIVRFKIQTPLRDPSLFKLEYITNQKSYKQLAKEYNLTESFVKELIHVLLPPQGETKRGRFTLNERPFHKEELYQLYIIDRLTIAEIVEKTQSTVWIITRSLIENNIPIRHGNARLVKGHPLAGKKSSFETRKKQSVAKLKIPEEEWTDFCPRADFDYVELKRWSKAVRKRDHYKCRICHAKKSDSRLDAHHIYSKSKYPQFAYDIENGITLCYSCHLRVTHKEDNFISQFASMNRDWEIYRWSGLGEINHE